MNKTPEFNLLDEQWIPVLWNNGKVTRVGIKEALTQAHRIRQIAASNPMDRVAVIRFLLALLYWCKGNPPEEGNLKPDDPFPEDWFTKLDENKECFNLLGEGKRFLQHRKTKEELLTVNYLIHEIPTGTNKAHFRHSTDKVNGLCPACCAMGLLRLPIFATSGGRGKPPCINMKPPIYAIPLDATIASTLRISWTTNTNIGTPSWMKPDLLLPKTGQVPLLTGLTWLPRRVWLSNQGDEGICISCSHKERLVYLSVFAAIGSTRTDENRMVRTWEDPHVIYSNSPKGEIISLHASDAIGASDAAANQFMKIIERLITFSGLNTLNSLWLVGFATVQNDKYLEAVEWIVPRNSFFQTEQEPIVNVNMLLREIAYLKYKVKALSEKATRDHVEILHMLSVIQPHAAHKMTERLRELCSNNKDAWQDLANEYNSIFELIANSYSPGETTAAVRKRKEFNSSIPLNQPDKETTRKKGATK